MKHVVVIGAGQAGASCVARLRSSGFEGSVTMIGSEPVPPYQRPPLSKGYLLGEITPERLFLRPEAFYADNNIELRLSATVTDIDVIAKTVVAGSETLCYDELVFATGSLPHRLPATIGGNLSGVFTLRNLSDVDAAAPYFTEKSHVLIVGGGYIGLEVAAVAAKRGLRVTLVEKADRILKRVAALETSNYFRDLHASHGVDIREGIGLTRLVGNNAVNMVELSDGSSLAVDFVIVGVGVAPSTSLACEAGIEIDNGIKVDSMGRTSVQYVWAAGDCASFPHHGSLIRLESVPNAIEQSECVADNILGANKDYLAKPWFWSDQYDVKLQIAGLIDGYDRVVTRGNGTSKSFWYYREEDLLSVNAANDPRAYMVGKRLIEAGKSADPLIVRDTDADLKVLLR
ncbi:MAG: FAD-dependent oxidoreductase [Tateyamaria sp.]|nr:FAD-dependent oxidoreductase [Tateyamaria sp.]